MAKSDQLERLNRRLNQNSLGVVGAVTDQAASSALVAARSTADNLRRYALDRPWITLLLAFEIGYFLARMGRRHAHA